MEKSVEATSRIIGLSKLISIIPGLILGSVYVLSTILIARGAYNLLIAGVLILVSMSIRILGLKYKTVALHMLLIGVLMGFTGILPPIYFTIFLGILSPTELALSITCITLTILTLIAFLRKKD
ncbi:MAG: hypothetical protein ACUVQ0_00210 [Thermoproteota archaeon]